MAGGGGGCAKRRNEEAAKRQHGNTAKAASVAKVNKSPSPKVQKVPQGQRARVAKC